MASIEFIKNRIEGTKKNITKLEAKLARIEKAKATNWEVNPYWYHESDLRSTTRDLEKAKESLAKYEADLATANEKAASRNVPAITEFLDNWKLKTAEFYRNSLPEYTKALDAYREEDHKYTEWWNRQRWHVTPEERKEKDREHRKMRERFREHWSWFEVYAIRHYDRVELDEEKLEKDLTNEYNRKYDWIIERTNEIVGQITDASYLSVGDKGDLNGIIKGTKGDARVQTIGAGGWNIQRFHFRTLIDRV